jgi:hypothetical protein
MRKKHPLIIIYWYFRESFVDLEHGTFTVYLKGNIVFLQLFGEFNEYSVIAYDKQIKKIVNELNGRPFAILVDNLHLIGGTPEAYVESNKHNEWLASQYLLGKASVYPSIYLKNVDELLVTSKSKLNVQNFDKMQDALIWLEHLNSLELTYSNKHTLINEPILSLVS